MRRALCCLLLAVGLAGCGGSSASPTATPAASPTNTKATAAPAPAPTATPVHLSGDYATFLSTLCRAFVRRDANAVANLLPHYEYNDGVRYGHLGDGEGSTGDPSILSTWLASSHVRCRLITPDVAGHGTLLAGTWSNAPGRWALIEADIYNGHDWRINDFTFGRRAELYAAMQTSHPIVRYHG